MQRQKGVGDLEKQVMEFVWKHGASTSAGVRAGVSKERPLTDSTVRTVLRRLEAKGFVEHELDGRQFLYSSARERRNVAAEHVRNVIKKFCRGSLEELLTGLVDHRVVDSAELRRLAERIEAQQK